jgi:hypothetical protein
MHTSRWLVSMIVAAAAAAPCVGHAATVVLQNDSFLAGQPVVFQSGFMSGEMAGATLGPVGPNAVIERIELLFGSGPTMARTVTLRIHADAGTAAPGALLHSASYLLTPGAALQQIDVSAAQIAPTAGNIRVAIELTHTGLPSLANDTDGTTQGGRNWIFIGGQWMSTGSVGVDGDWILRAIVSQPDTVFRDGFEPI